MEITETAPALSYCFYTSFIFLINSAFALYKQYYFYSFLFLLLTISSILYHYPVNSIYVNFFDKLCIITVVLYGGRMLYQKNMIENLQNVSGASRSESVGERLNSVAVAKDFDYVEVDVKSRTWTLMVIFTFLIINYLYIYGYFSDCYCFHPDKCNSDIWHGILHIISSIGHNIIILLGDVSVGL